MIDRSFSPAGYSSLDAAALSQNARLLQVRTPLGDTLTAERMRLQEGVSELFALTLDCLAPSAELDVEPLLGKEISVDLLLADGSRRRWHAVVEGVDALGADGGLARYRLHAAPWLATLRLRRDSFLYQDKSATDILSEIFADYPLASFSFDITEPLAPRPIRTQYRETDLAFVLRLMAESGLSFRFDHQQGDGQDGGGTGGAQHRLVVFDAGAARPENPASPLRFHRADATESEDSILRFGAARSVQPNRVTRVAWNERALLAHGAEARSDLDVGAVPPLEDYDFDGHGRYTDDAGAEALAARSLQAHESRTVRFDGGGTARQMMPGHTFALTQHDRYAEGSGQSLDEMGGNRYTLLRVTHEAVNNLGAQAAQVLDAPDLERGAYRNTFSAAPAAAALLPGWRAKPTAPEGVTAVVVTAQDAPITSGRDLRVKVQFPWQRGKRPLSGGLPHRSHGDDAGNAPGDDSSGTWLRVTGAQAGPNWGAHHLPRQGTEVVVEFLDGDIDQPVVVAQLYNDADLPPWSAGVNAEANHPGTLSGWHSQGLDGQGHSQWLFDDTAGQVRTRLSSSIAASQLGLGYLVKQAPDESNRGEWRGTGFELRSDAWTVVRSGQGMLLSANVQTNARSTLADAPQALALMRGAQHAAQRINAAATQRQARSLAATDTFDALIEAVDPKAKGRYPANVGGQQAVKAANGERSGTDPVERIDGARMLIDAPASLNFATPASAIVHASENLHVTAQADGHVAARQTFASASGRATSLFVQDGGIRAIAANAPVSIHAHTDMLELLAGQDVTITSTTDSIEILANQRITLQAGGGSIVMDGADIVFKGPGMFSVKGASHNLIGPASDAAALPALPSTQVGDVMLVKAELVHRPEQMLQALAGSGQTVNAAGASDALAGTAAATTASTGASSTAAAGGIGATLAKGASAVSSGLASLQDSASGMLDRAKSMASDALKPIQDIAARANDAVTSVQQTGAGMMSAAAGKAGDMAGAAIGSTGAGQMASSAIANATPSLMAGAAPSLMGGATPSLMGGATPSLMAGAAPSLTEGAAGALASAMPASVTQAAGAAARASGMAAQAGDMAAQAGNMASTLSAASGLAAAGGSQGGVGAAIQPLMTQAMNAMGDKGATLGSAVNTLLAMPDVNADNIPAVAGAILSTPGLSDSAIPTVVGAILQSPSVTSITLPKVAETIMNIPAVANSPYPGLVRRAMDAAGIGLPGTATRPAGQDGTGGASGPADGGGAPGGTLAVSTYRSQSGAQLQYVNLKTSEARWNDGQALNSLDRQTNRPKIRVSFNRRGEHRFTVKVMARRTNAVYTARERDRQPLYRDPDQSTYQYVTDPDGTKVVDNITLPAAGLNSYLFEVLNDQNQTVMTEMIETVRRMYIQEIRMPGPENMERRYGFQPTADEYARHGIDVLQLPYVQTRGDANSDVWTDEGDARMRQLVQSVYPRSEGARHEPYTIAVCHIDRLAAQWPIAPLIIRANAGPGMGDVEMDLLGPDGNPAYLWLNIDPNDDWFLECLFEYTDAAGTVKRAVVPKDRVTPIAGDASEPSACPSVRVRMAGLLPVPTSGRIILRVKLLESAAGGVAFLGTNILGVAVRTPWQLATMAYQQETLVHEMGHLLGMTPSGPEWANANEGGELYDASKLDGGRYFYSDAGNHCHFGLPANQANSSNVGACVMFGGDCQSIRFCPSCSEAVRKVDMSNGWTTS
ncbi:type VI secretion system secreted protein VgrG [Achromobacter deleyi]|uniref:type VI secretion system tip protein TssI/VgrG n=2 Tax=Achromobacter TaxID=222 RepID=UPI002860902E|nr:type VI secretion system tip protein TssI/VgrG [Achromobacter deleyi]MDR6602067.1 type VI secretion system secreted protein VgrG [Achromobacter deleyi]